MVDRETAKSRLAAKLARLEAENARLRRLAAELTADITELQAAQGIRSRDGAVESAHRLLVGALPQE